MPKEYRYTSRTTHTFLLTLLATASLLAQAPVAPTAPTNDAPNPYKLVPSPFTLPDGRRLGSISSVEPDIDGRSIWIADRCGANTCVGSKLPVVLKFDVSGELVRSFGTGMFAFPHGIHVDAQGNVWVVDGVPPAAPGAAVPAVGGHHIVKFSPEGKVLLTLGMAGMPGADEVHFNQPSDVITAPNGDIFVADGHGGKSNARIVKYNRDGRFVKQWGTLGSGPGQLDTPHSLAMDSRGRLFVADRANNRIQIFDQEGTVLDEWRQFSRPSGIFIDKNDVIYVADSESNKRRKRAEWKRGIRIGSARDGKVMAFIPDDAPNVDEGSFESTSGPEGVAADAQGNVYGAEVGQKGVKKYVRK
ncbi:MAG TPA: peptidyl-alpha-hydroxyglycine alpha-amidating lyase family protein [Vicinamibacterales bacterium]|nr:peptidyl-alpha-hydroxyglycine alpha-amidating lyase family protein [Vicinamibacterales bacterium]